MAPMLLGDTARGLFALPVLRKMDERKNLSLCDVRQVGNDMRVIARVK
jgi:diaminohydroxyphosphoribosylaminopyrimidine deaminase / 5-amino-6-(5-phosphoribosylamino)uracil reductase